MSARTYPRLGDGMDMRRHWGHALNRRSGQPPELVVNIGTKHRCFVCGAPATRITVIQVTFMRGDDEQEETCEVHRKDLAAIVAKWRATGTKAKVGEKQINGKAITAAKPADVTGQVVPVGRDRRPAK